MRDHWTQEDQNRLKPSNKKVLEAMQGAGWVDLAYVAAKVGLNSASTVASRLRDIKAETQWTYERKTTATKGLNEYRLIPKEPEGSSDQLNLFGASA